MQQLLEAAVQHERSRSIAHQLTDNGLPDVHRVMMIAIDES